MLRPHSPLNQISFLQPSEDGLRLVNAWAAAIFQFQALVLLRGSPIFSGAPVSPSATISLRGRKRKFF